MPTTPAVLTAEEQERKIHEERLRELNEYMRVNFGGNSSALDRALQELREPVIAYPEGDAQRYTSPMNRNGQVVPSREGTIHGIDRERGEITVRHDDGSISRYAGVVNIPESLQAGQSISRTTAMGDPDREHSSTSATTNLPTGSAATWCRAATSR
jgi:hypothetical protein